MNLEATAPLGPSLLRKWACMLYEGLLVFGVVFMAGLVFGLITQTRNALDNRIGLQVFLFVAVGVYFSWFWSKGQTLAMKTWHLRLEMPNGETIPKSRAMLRYVLAWIGIFPPIAFAHFLQMGPQKLLLAMPLWLLLWTGVSQLRTDRQMLHDVWAGTRLIYAPVADSQIAN